MNAPTHADYRATKRFTAVDGLRGVAILLVIAWHVDPVGFGMRGLEGVTAFLLLSGYLLTTLSLREEDQRGRLSVRAFYVRRAFRILPGYVFVLVSYCVLLLGVGIAGAPEPFREALPYYLVYLNELAPADQVPMSAFAHTWSLGIQEKFYVLWPVIGFVAWRMARERIVGTAALMGISAVLGVATGIVWVGSYAVVMAGCLLAIVLHHPAGFRWLRWLGTPWGGLIAVALAFGTHLAISPLPLATEQALFMFPVALLLAGVVVAGIRGSWAAPLNWTPIGWVGRRAYGIYLLHVLAIWAAHRVVPAGWGSVPVLLVAIPVTLVAAAVMYRVIEEPMLKRGNAISKRMRRPVRTEQPATAPPPAGQDAPPRVAPGRPVAGYDGAMPANLPVSASRRVLPGPATGPGRAHR